jgi:predicted nucleic acid-binding protein
VHVTLSGGELIAVAYFDTAFILKCYIPEAGSEAVRRTAEGTEQLVSSELARAEFAAAVHRKRRERVLAKREADAVLEQFDADCRVRVWEFIPVSSAVLTRVWNVFSRLPVSVTLRSADAIHCATAAEIGLTEIYSNDRHLLGAAAHFKLKAMDSTHGET